MNENNPNYQQPGFNRQQQSNLFNEAPPAVYGTFWERLGAVLIDGVILGVAGAVLNNIFGLGFSREVLYNADTGAIYAAYWKSNSVPLVIQWLYFALMESSAKQATLGKMALGLKVTGMNGQRISFLNATGRYFGKIISAIIVFIGFLMVLWDDKKQALHDKMAGTLVVKK
ncbi:RDD family protein [Niabella sp. CC-SYL272]|uniref:RDD family protein n=1 Tax=Niabella agricola TaxID=2891571 RepID=UPI001F26E8E5|nr:RDD family protein [Niabella agricola]MCF3111849.1 RDD family protein [Niabella agricola]